MSERLEAMRRIVKVQSQIQRLAEWRVLESEAKVRANAAARADLATFVEQPEAVGGLASAALKQAQRLVEREGHLTLERDQRIAANVAATRRLKGSETLVDTLGRAHREAEERKSLEAIIEAAMARRRVDDV